jgi:hypothetical protein
MQSIDQPGSHHYRMLSLVMEIFGASRRSLKAKRYSRSKDNKGEVHNPALTCLLATTNESLMKGLTGEAATDGFLGRMLPLAACDVPPLAEGYIDKGRLPEDIREAFQRLKDWKMPTSLDASGSHLVDRRVLHGNLAAGKKFWLIKMTPEAEQYYLQARRIFDEVRGSSSPTIAPIWNRAMENALRVAAIVALGNAASTDTLDQPVCDLEMIRWSVVLVHQAIRSITPDVTERAVDGAFDGLRKSLVNSISRKADEDGWAREKDVIASCKCADRPYRQVKEELEGLTATGFNWVERETMWDCGELVEARPARLRLTQEGKKACGLEGGKHDGKQVSELVLGPISPPFGL